MPPQVADEERLRLKLEQADKKALRPQVNTEDLERLKKIEAADRKLGAIPPTPLGHDMPKEGWSLAIPPPSEASRIEDLPPVDRPAAGGVQPTHIIESKEDEFEGLNNQIYLQRGVEIPSKGSVSNVEFNKWARKYLASLEERDPATLSILNKAQADPALREQVVKPFRQNLRLLYQIQHAIPSPKEESSAFSDAWNDWTRGKLVDGRSDDPNQPGIKMGEGVAKFPAQGLMDIYQKYKAMGLRQRTPSAERLMELGPQDRATLLWADGENFFAFYDRHKDFYVANHRLERLGGRPQRDPQRPPVILHDQFKPYRDTIERGIYDVLGKDITIDAAEAAVEQQAVNRVPRKPEFHHSVLAPISPFIQGLVRASGEEAQAASIAAQQQAARDEEGIAAYRQQNPLIGTELMPPEIFHPKRFYPLIQEGLGATGAALNWLTLGAFEAIYDGAKATGRAGFEAVTGNPDDFNLYIHAAPGQLYKHLVSKLDPKGTEELAKIDGAWRDSFPVDDPTFDRLDSIGRLNAPMFTKNALRRLADTKEHPTIGAAMQSLGLNEPYAQDFFSGLIGNTVEDGTGLILAALGSSTLWRMVRGFRALPAIPEGMKRFTEIEKHLIQERAFSPIPAAERAPLLNYVTEQLEKVKSVEAARDIAHRLAQEVEARGPLDPALTGGVVAKIKDAAAKFDALDSVNMTNEGKQALAGLKEPIADLGITDAQMVMKGEGVSVNPREGARVAQNLKAMLDRMEEIGATATPELLKTFKPETYKQMVEAVNAQVAARKDLVNRRGAVLDVADRIGRALEEELGAHKVKIVELEAGRNASKAAYNSSIRESFDRLVEIEFDGGEIPRPNPELYKDAYRVAYDARQLGGPFVARLINDQKLLSVIAGKEAGTIRNMFRRGSPAAMPKLRPILDEYLRENARPEFEHRPRNPRPRVTALKEIQKKIEKIKDPSSQVVDLTPAEVSMLNEIRNAPLDPKEMRKVVEAYNRELDSSRKTLSQRDKFRTDLGAFRSQIEKIDPIRPGQKIRVDPKLSKRIEAELGSPQWLVRDEKFVSINEGLQQRHLSGLEMFHEATKELSEDARLLNEGLLRFSSLDFAMASAANPRSAIWLQRENLRHARDYQNFHRWQAEKFENILKKRLTPARYQELLVQMSKGEVTDDIDAAKLLQRQRQELVLDAYRVGRISREDYERYMGNVRYYHGKFERKDVVNTAPPSFILPARFKELRVNPLEFAFKIPDDSYYVAWKRGDKIHHQAGFKNADEATAWIEASKLPDDTEISVHSPWKFSEREAAGLIVDAGTSHLSLVERMALNNANTLVSRAISKAPKEFVRDKFNIGEVAAQQIGPHVLDKDGSTWFLMDDPRTPHLKGKYVHEDVIQWLRNQSAPFGWYKIFADEMQKGMGAWDILSGKSNKLIPIVDRWLETTVGRAATSGWAGKALGSMAHVFGMTKVAMSPFMPATQMASNVLWNMPLAGFNILSPTGFSKFLKYSSQGIASWVKGSVDDPYWRQLARSGAIDSSAVNFTRLQHDVFERNWKSMEGVEARLVRSQRDIADVLLDPDAKPGHLEKLVEHRLELEGELEKFSRKGFKDWMKDLMKSDSALHQDVFGAFTGKGKISEAMYAWVGAFDNIAKYSTLRHLVEDRGMTMEVASQYVNAFMQNLHQVPDTIRQLNRRLGGSMFTSYPANYLRTFYNALKYRKGWLSRYVGKIAAWNYAMIAGRGEDPEDALEAYALMEGNGKRTAVSDAMFLLSRIQLPGPGGGAIGLNSVWGVLQGYSPMARRADELITKSDLPMWAEIPARLGANVASKFVLSHPALSMMTQALSGRDTRGDPLNDFSDILKMMYRTMAPEMAPGGRDFDEIVAAGSTAYMNPYTAEKKSIADHFMRRMFEYIPPERFSSHARLKAAKEAQLAGNPARFRDIAAIAFVDRLKSRVYASGAVKDDGSVDLQKAAEVTKSWLEEEDHKTYFIGPDGKIPEHVGATQIQEKAARATVPGEIAAFRVLSITEMAHTYAMWRRYDKKPDPDLNQKILAVMNMRAKNDPSMEEVASDLKAAVKGWEEDPEMPQDAKDRLRAMFGIAAQNMKFQRPRLPTGPR